MFRYLTLVCCLALFGCASSTRPPVAQCPSPASTLADNTALMDDFSPRCATTPPTPQPTRNITAVRFLAAGRMGYRIGVTDYTGASPQAHHNCYLVGHGEEATVYFSTIYRPAALVVIPQNPSTGHVISEISSVVLPEEVTIGGTRVATQVLCHRFMNDMVACEHTIPATATN